MQVFLDDELNTPEGWVRVYWPSEAIALLRERMLAGIRAIEQFATPNKV